MVVGQCCMQDLQVPTDVQPVLEHLCARTDRCRSICRGAISDEGSQYISEVFAIRSIRLGAVFCARHSTGKTHFTYLGSIRQILTLCDMDYLSMFFSHIQLDV